MAENLTFLILDKNLKGDSTHWANWMSQLTPTTCKYCVDQHGKIVDIVILNHQPEVEAHPNCKCVYVPMKTRLAGTATDAGPDGADVYWLNLHKLPDCYVSKKAAEAYGWKKWKGNLNDVLPGKMIGGDLYENDNLKLPQSSGRIWYKADINYSGGYRNKQRILYSNDGLIFVTYDHYLTFHEITR